jgi:hypothetical protein
LDCVSPWMSASSLAILRRRLEVILGRGLVTDAV